MEPGLPVLFIINPVSGTGKRKTLPHLIARTCRKRNVPYRIAYTEYAGHATVIASEAVEEHLPLIVAVGGDGTINEIARALIGKPCALGILPAGSGNGLARSLHLSMQPATALRQILSGQVIDLDVLHINGEPCFNLFGTGFDSKVSKLFEEQPKRGFWSYFLAVFKAFFTFHPLHYEVCVKGAKHRGPFYLVVAANSSQYGNDAYIAPRALPYDGVLDLMLVKPFPFYAFVPLLARLLLNRIHHSKYILYYTTTQVIIAGAGKKKFDYHIDGEYRGNTGKIQIKLEPECLRVIVPAAAGKFQQQVHEKSEPSIG